MKILLGLQAQVSRVVVGLMIRFIL